MKISFFFFIFFFSQCLLAQSIIFEGQVLSDSDNTPIVGAVLKIYNKSNNELLTYTFTNEKGYFQFGIENINDLNIIVSSIGFEEKIFRTSDLKRGEEFLKFTLKETLELLDEVIVEAKKPVTVSNDTISYQADFFTNNTESSVEDLLKKIPGLTIDNEGTIKIGNREIEKIMVEGDDMFGKGYKILSKNMPAYPIEEVQILKKFTSNRLLKGLVNSEGVALNLKLKEDSKNIWFGNQTLGYGTNGFYEGKGNLMNFSKKNKFYFLKNINTLPYDITGDIKNLISPYQENEFSSIGDNQKLNNILNLRPLTIDLDKDRTSFKKAKLLSLNSIFNPSDKFKIKMLGFYNRDINNFYKNSFQEFNFADVNFINTELYELQNAYNVAFGKLDLIYNVEEDAIIESVTKFSKEDFLDESNIKFNEIPINENLQKDNFSFDQKVNFTKKLRNNLVYIVTGRIIKESSPQNYLVNQFVFQELFPSLENVSSIQQKVINEMNFAGLNLHIIKNKNNILSEFQVGNENRKDLMFTDFFLKTVENYRERPEGFQNLLEYRVSDFYVKGKYQVNLNDFDIIARLDLHQLSNYVENYDSISKQSPFFINPSIGFNWKLNDYNRISTSFSNSTSNAKILDIFDGFVLTSYQSITRGASNFNQLNSSNFILNYQFGNWSKSFFSNTFLTFIKNHDFFSNNLVINPKYILSEKIIINDRKFLILNSKIEYFINVISTNIKLDLGYTYNDYKNVVNSSVVRNVKSSNYKYGFEFRSGYKGLLNYHVGTTWNYFEIFTERNSSYYNNMTFLDLDIAFNNKLNLQLKSEKYSFDNGQFNDSYYFVDIDLTYKILKNKGVLSLIGNNLLNTEQFRNVVITDLSTSINDYRIIPRYLMLKFEFRY